MYPMKFCALQDNYSWGSETFRLADLGYRDSLVREGWLAGNSLGEIMDMYMDQMVGENVFEYWGRQFPVCIRHIKVCGKMPLRVSPADDDARQRWDFLGKEKLWYVLRCGRDASLAVGFRKDTDASELIPKCTDNTVADILNFIAPYPGQCIHIPAGTPHYASGDIEILEIAESSPLDFCLCSWGEPVSEEEFDPALDFMDVLDLIDFHRFTSCAAPIRSGGETVKKLLSLVQFEAGEISLSEALHVKGGDPESFTIYSCISGAASVQLELFGKRVPFRFESGETILVPADCGDFYLVPEAAQTLLVETVVPFRREQDPYVNPEVPASLPENA